MSWTVQQIASDAVVMVLHAGTSTEAEAGIVAVIAAAEERGRRIGVEERDKLLREVRAWIAGFSFSTSAGLDTRWILDRIDAALAPRDSGKEEP